MQGFLRAGPLGSHCTKNKKLLDNIYKGLDLLPHNFDMEQLDERLSQLQQELVGHVKINAYFGRIRTLIPATSGQHFGIIRTA